MIETIRNAWKIVDLRKKILYTVMMLIIFRLGSCIPVPLLNPAQMQELFNTENSMFGLLDIMSGGALQNATIFAMGISPYNRICPMHSVTDEFWQRRWGEIGT
jgi:preprotein translocase subunit SecY